MSLIQSLTLFLTVTLFSPLLADPDSLESIPEPATSRERDLSESASGAWSPSPQPNIVIQGPIIVRGEIASRAGERLTPVLLDDRPSWFFSSGYLSMRATQRGLDYAILDPDADSDPEGPVLSMSEASEYEAGYQSEIGTSLNSQDRLIFSYLCFDQRARSDVSEPTGGRIWIPMLHPQDASNYTRVESVYELDLSVFDLTYSRRFSVFEGVATVFGGVRIGEIQQRFETTGYLGATGTNAEEAIKTSFDFQGAGLRGGFGMRRSLIGSVAVYGRGIGSLLRGTLGSSHHLRDDNDLQVDIVQSVSDSIPIAELELGLHHEPRWSKGHMSFDLAWQQTTWFGLVQVQQFTDDGGADRGGFVNVGHNLNLSAIVFRATIRR